MNWIRLKAVNKQSVDIALHWTRYGKYTKRRRSVTLTVPCLSLLRPMQLIHARILHSRNRMDNRVTCNRRRAQIVPRDFLKGRAIICIITGMNIHAEHREEARGESDYHWWDQVQYTHYESESIYLYMQDARKWFQLNEYRILEIAHREPRIKRITTFLGPMLMIRIWDCVTLEILIKR